MNSLARKNFLNLTLSVLKANSCSLVSNQCKHAVAFLTTEKLGMLLKEWFFKSNVGGFLQHDCF